MTPQANRQALSTPRSGPCLDCSLQHATRDGFLDGRANRQHTWRNYFTAEEWLAWLTGWRQGQAERRRRLSLPRHWRDCGRHRPRRAA